MVASFHDVWAPNSWNPNENIKQAKGNECSQYKSAAAMFSSILPVCHIHIFSSENQESFTLITSYNTACFALCNLTTYAK
jgi:hypothetical protein